MSIAPRSHIDSGRLRITRRSARLAAPRKRVAATITGSSSGVSPKATDTANSPACAHCPVIQPLTASTMGTITAIKRNRALPTDLTPASTLLGGRAAFAARVAAPQKVCEPVAMTTAVPPPPTPDLPAEHLSGRAPWGGRPPPPFSGHLPTGRRPPDIPRPSHLPPACA